MATIPNPAGDAEAPRVAFRLGDAVVRFRYYAELNYAEAELDGDRKRAFACIEREWGKLVGHTVRLMDALPAVQELGSKLVASARSQRQRFEEIWLDADHRKRLRDRDNLRERTDSAGEPTFGLRVLNGAPPGLPRSPLGIEGWSHYQASVEELSRALGGVYGPLFELGRLVSGVCNPPTSSYDVRLGTHLEWDADHLLTVIGPRLVELVRSVRASSPLLGGVDGWLDGGDPHGSAIRLRSKILRTLKAPYLERRSEADSSAASPLAAPGNQPAAEGNRPPAESNMLVSNSSGPDEGSARGREDAAALRKLKKEMDETGRYVGESLPVLRVFEQIQDLNRQPDEPVVILGPSGVGKTALARIIHDTSSRRAKPFKDIQANDVSGGDQTIARDKWSGRGKNAGLGKGDAQPVDGWLQECAGGTIFVDELHNLDPFNQEYLRKVLDRRPIPLSVGRGPDVLPDVRLIFATFRHPDELLQDGKLQPDFHRRLGKRYLSVPPLNERKDDIPLFVEALRGGWKYHHRFLLALFEHDWSVGQVDALIKVIRGAVSRTTSGKLDLPHLSGLLPEVTLARVRTLSDVESKTAILQRLIRLLESKGFRRNDRTSPLNQQLAKLLHVSEPTVSRWRRLTRV